MSTTFAQNAAATPTRVFAGSVHWPAVPTPQQHLDPWSLRFDFAQPYLSFPGRVSLGRCLCNLDLGTQGSAGDLMLLRYGLR